ncbi:hypothetical protein [Miltoncostaea marina]|uniref:hypothetical protein n=1 Tax=Miltoncostaea marina TaxID=2843215 RepID=UPI001C3D8A4E|nr:hypothetical protein [Miltoncostaea marina]
MGRIDAKVAAGTLGAAIATLVWTLLAVFVDQIREMPPESLAVCSTASATILGAVLGYLVPNEASPVPGDGVNLERAIEERTGDARPIP